MRSVAPILVCFALDREAAPLRRRRGEIPGVRILVTGMGPRRAAASVESSIANDRPDIVLTCGFAGALDPKLIHHQVLIESADVFIRETFLPHGVSSGKFCCTHRIAIRAEEKRALWDNTRASAVEMESGEIHQVCARHKIPCATIRVISDVASETLPLDFNQLRDSEEQLSNRSLAWAILKRPWILPQLAALGRNSARASEKLAAILVRGIQDLMTSQMAC
jgi:adenosylhomocysteine nucleosidase